MTGIHGRGPRGWGGRSAGDDDDAFRVLHDVAAHRAEQEPPEATEAPAPDDDEVGFPLGGHLEHGARRRAVTHVHLDAHIGVRGGERVEHRVHPGRVPLPRRRPSGALPGSVTTTPSCTSRFQPSTAMTSEPLASAVTSARSTARALPSLPSTPDDDASRGTDLGARGHDDDRAVRVRDDGERDRADEDALEAAPGGGADDDAPRHPRTSRTTAAAGGPQGTAGRDVETGVAVAHPGDGAVENVARALLEVVGQARRAGGERLVRGQLQPRVDGRHEPERRAEPGRLVGCPVDDGLVGRRPVQARDHGAGRADRPASASSGSGQGTSLLTTFSAIPP